MIPTSSHAEVPPLQQNQLKISTFLSALSQLSFAAPIASLAQQISASASSIRKRSQMQAALEAIGGTFEPLKGVDELAELGRPPVRRRKHKNVTSDVIVAISDKTLAGLEQLYSSIKQTEMDSDEPSHMDEGPGSEMGHSFRIQDEKGEQDIQNQFMEEQFAQPQSDIIGDLPLDTYKKAETDDNKHHQTRAASIIIELLANNQAEIVKSSFSLIQKCCASPQHNQSESDRPSTGRVDMFKGSSQSQRIKSAVSKKGSEGSGEQFNFDLTAKTKNSKNPFKISITKQDSLMYSAQSGFGLNPSSPLRKGDSFIGKSLHQIEDEEEPPGLSNIEGRQSQDIQERIEGEQRQTISKSGEKEDDFEIPYSMRNVVEGGQGGSYRHKDGSQSSDCYADDEEQKETESAHFEKGSFQKETRKRVGTEVAVKKTVETPSKSIKRFNKIELRELQPVSQSGVFSTQIAGYQSKITKLREIKELKKKKLEEELAIVNQEIKMLNKKQEEEMSGLQKNNYASRVKISDNKEAKKKAESLVKNLRSQKRHRNMAKIGQFKSLDKNINDYMEELTKMRAQNEEKIKQKKKLEILERMKQQEIRKMTERRKIEASQQFVMHIKVPQREQESPKRTVTKMEEEGEEIVALTPELTQKKAQLSKIRSFSVKKSRGDLYEQILS